MGDNITNDDHKVDAYLEEDTLLGKEITLQYLDGKVRGLIIGEDDANGGARHD
eukprot:CAMPEP_0170562754 /NCGR_PEP_ID=MMETSP0211-20121228/62326_1 /TAXON_ID=311385 /ORGANISM="Pseudokeronopsis sp., Strain OXSARD2" /LENGTH=52 /DNA_ID=CAMNT_0010880071 /DNA_START=664 /DNA_END=822 /DNA_ORIENTATION=+